MYIEEIKQELSTIKRTSFGISIPELRKVAKRIARENYKEFLERNKNETYELRLLHAYTIGYVKSDIKTLLGYFEEFMPLADDWALNDALCQNFTAARKYPKEVWDFLMKYKYTSDEFESRKVSVVLLSHYLNDEYIDKTLTVIQELNTNDYYSSMGVAWAIATAMGKYPEKCLNILKPEICKLDKETLKRTLQKIRESYRVNDEIKKITREFVK